MHKNLEVLANADRELTYIFCAGFEDRVTRAPVLLSRLGIRAKRVVALKYDGREHLKNLATIREMGSTLNPEIPVRDVDALDVQAIQSLIKEFDPSEDTLAVDITGLSRTVMMVLLSAIYERQLGLYAIYTEANEYYPTKADFRRLTKGRQSEEGFLMLSQFENAAMVYSSHCDLEEIRGHQGRMLPNYPLMLITFLTFKRGRMSVILQAFEANTRILIRGVPVRDDLKWRADAIKIPNSDLLDGSVICDLETLNWRETYQYLAGLYEMNNNKYRYNFLLAPLGSKMQTVGAWLFAVERRDIRLISSTPKKLFHEKYSKGYGQTFLVDDLPPPISPISRLLSS